MRAFRCGIYFIPLVLLLPGFASAQTQTYVYETVRVGPGQYAPSGVRVPVTMKVNQRFHEIVPVANKKTIGALGRNLIRGGGVGLAVSAVITGLGYLIDEVTGDIKKREFELGPPSNSNYVPSISGLTSDPACRANPASEVQLGYQFVAFRHESPTFCSPDRPYRYGYAGWDCPASHPVAFEEWSYVQRCYPPGTTRPTTERIVDISAADIDRIDNELDTELSPYQKYDILRRNIIDVSPRGTVSSDPFPIVLDPTNPRLRDFYDDWPEFREAVRRLINAEAANDLAESDPEFPLDPEDKEIVDGGFDSPPLPEGLPSFCEWAAWLCEPFVPDDHPNVPELDLTAPGYSSGLPINATCPAPISVETSFFGGYELSFQPACDLAAAIRIPLLAIAYLLAGYIVVGVRR